MASEYYVHGIRGPIVIVRGGNSLPMMSLVYIGEQRMRGEVVFSSGEGSVVQIYEDPSGLRAGDPVYPTFGPMSVELGPGIMGEVFDGIGRPLSRMRAQEGPFIKKGADLPTLDPERLWDVTVTLKDGDEVSPGQVFAVCRETDAVIHRVMVPPGVHGTLCDVLPSGEYTVHAPLANVTGERGGKTPLMLSHAWPVRTPRPFAARRAIRSPLMTGQHIIDTLFPVGKGGCAALPGPSGTGKTALMQQIAKWSDADINIYVCCGERGSDIERIYEYLSATDPRTGRPFMERCILIANTSNMPVAARESSIYTGITIAEYYRDMGYHVALMADSTTRWAEALREISSHLDLIPAEEGFPANLSSHLAGFYERAGFVETLGGSPGSVTAIGAVSPGRRGLSEPVTQYTRRFVRCLWVLSSAAANEGSFPAISLDLSYTEYYGELAAWYSGNFGPEFELLRARVIALLHEGAELLDTARFIGTEALPDDQRLTIRIARVIRRGLLSQDTYGSDRALPAASEKFEMLGAILYLYEEAGKLIARGIPLRQIGDTGIFSELERMKYDVGTGDDSEKYRRLADDAIRRVRMQNDLLL